MFFQLKNGMGSASLGMDEVYTFTTVTTGNKGQYDAPPPSKSFPLPYSDNFDSEYSWYFGVLLSSYFSPNGLNKLSFALL